METECILWKGQTFTTHGNTYGIVGGKDFVLAHRYVYEKEVGIIPKDFVIDHLCRNGLCVNPKHLEAVTNIENIMRGNGAPAINARKTHCVRGHELSGDNLYNRRSGKRACRTCGNLYNASRKRHKSVKQLLANEASAG